MEDIRVLVVDDSVAIRKIVTDLLNETDGMRVIGTASNGEIALKRIEELNPDIVTLDIEMPVMSGLEALPEIQKLRPQMPVVVFSAQTEQGAVATLDALSLGASDYVTKPSNAGSPEEAAESIQTSLIPKIESLCVRSGALEARLEKKIATTRAPTQTEAASTAPRRIDLVAIGISTGGPNALGAMLPELPADLPVPIVIVQHMPPKFTDHLARRLDGECKINVREGESGVKLEPGSCWIAPGGLHMVVERHRNELVLDLNEAPPENHCRPAVDVLFRSVAEALGPRSLGVMMTGMGQDGLLGCEVLRERGSQVIVQDEASSTVWSMPGVVAKAGLAVETLPLDRIASAINRRSAIGRTQLTKAEG